MAGAANDEPTPSKDTPEWATSSLPSIIVPRTGLDEVPEAGSELELVEVLEPGVVDVVEFVDAAGATVDAVVELPVDVAA
jgi:hypothetical protein